MRLQGPEAGARSVRAWEPWKGIERERGTIRCGLRGES